MNSMFGNRQITAPAKVAQPQQPPMMPKSTIGAPFLERWGQMNGQTPQPAGQGWGDSGGNTFLPAWAKMNGIQPPQQQQRPPGMPSFGNNTFLGAMGQSAQANNPTAALIRAMMLR